MFEVPLDGALGFVFLAALPIAFLLNIAVHALYRRAILRSMRMQSAGHVGEFDVPEARARETRALQFQTGEALGKTAIRGGLALRYLLAGLVYAVAQMTVLFTLEGIEFGPNRSTVVAAVLATPIIPFCIHVAGSGRLYVWLGTALWIGLLALRESAAPMLIAIEVGMVAVAALVLANRVFRTTALMLYLIALMLIIPMLFVLDLALVLVPVFVGSALYVAAFILLAVGVVLSLITARVIAWISAGASDLMLQSHAIWFMMTVWQITLLSSSQGVLALLSVLSFIAYAVALYLLSLTRRGGTRPLLLFLRVFGQRRLQQKFTHGPMTEWRQEGPVMLIGSADLATETLDSEELAAFLSRSLNSLFITSPEDLEDALARRAEAAHDGLYPVLDYYCQDDTWRPSVRTLMSRASRVVLDLRGFSAQNQGVQFEITELVRRVDIETVNVLVDDTTDVALAQKLFQQEWDAAHETPSGPAATLQFLTVGN